MIEALLVAGALITPYSVPRVTVCEALAKTSAGELIQIRGVVRRSLDETALIDSKCPHSKVVLDFASSDDGPWVMFGARYCPGKDLIVVLTGRLNHRSAQSEVGTLYFVSVANKFEWKCVAK